jgi:hypothetical protein
VHSRAKVAAVALGATLVLSSCSLTSSITTSNQYDPSDGTGVVVGDVRAQNLLLVASAEGEPAALIGYLYNDDDGATATVTVTIGDTEETYRLAPMEGVQLGLGEGSEEFVTVAPADPGLIDSYTVTVEEVGASTGALPIVDGTLAEYQQVLTELDAVSS